MFWRPDKYQGLRDTFRKGNVDPDVDEELTHHLESLIESNLASGMSRSEAEADARQRFGDLARYRRETGVEERAGMATVQRRERLAVARHEIVRAWRALRRSPSFTVAAVLTLAIGIGATIALFTILDAVVLRPLPYPDAERLVRIFHPVPKIGPGERWNISTAELVHFSRESRTLERVGLYGAQRITILVEGRAAQVNAALVTAEALSMLGATPLLGRLHSTADNLRPNPPTVLLSEAFWRSHYGASRAVLGTMLRIEGGEAEIVGVVAGDLALPDWRVDIWLPNQYDPAAPARSNHVFWGLAKLRDGVTVDAASRELAGMVSSYPERFPTAYGTAFGATSISSTGFTTIVVPWKDIAIGDAGRVLWLLFAASGLVLLIAAVNVGNLFLVRSHATRREVAVRSLLGANRSQLAWHHLAESALVSTAGFMLGVGLAWLGLEAFLAAVPRDLGRLSVTIPRLAEVALGWRGIGLAGVVAAASAIGFAVVPLLADPAAGEAARATRAVTASKREGTIRNGLVVSQIALAVVLLAAAGLLLRTFQALRAVEPGFDPRGVLVANLALPFNRYQTYERTTGFYRRLIERMEELPSVVRASVGSDIPIESGQTCATFDYPGRPQGTSTSCILNAVIGPGYFEAIGADLEGRDLDWRDIDAKTGAAAVTDVLARRIFPDAATGLDRPISGPTSVDRPPYRVVAVPRGLHWKGLDRPPVEVAFFPLEPIPESWLWSPPARMYLVARVAGADPVTIMPEVRRIVGELDPEAAVEQARTMEQVVAGSLRRVTLLLTLLGVSAVAALFLSVIGLYGVIAYTVTRRTREIGLRIAIGAPIARVRGQIVRQSVVLALLGVALGMAGALLMTRLLATLLFGVSAADPTVLALVAVILVVVAVGASVLPATRAAAIDPVIALRSE